MKFSNIEIKARCANQVKIRSMLESKKAVFKGIDHQVDTYFKVNSGRLKLREGNIENYLVYYERENTKGPKESDTILLPSDQKTNPNLKEILLKSLGKLAQVDKKREIYFIDNVKFHLDNVKDLGTFVEIEARDPEGRVGKEKLLEQCKSYLDLFGIKKEDLLAGSYSDMMLERKTKSKNS